MKAAIASDHGKPIFDAGEEWRGATPVCLLHKGTPSRRGERTEFVVTLRHLFNAIRSLIDLHNSVATSEHVYVKRAAACCLIVQSKGTACDAVDLF